MKPLRELGIIPHPWKAGHDGNRSIVVAMHGTPFIVYDSYCERGTAKATADMISAAPDLYQSVLDLLEICGNVGDYLEYDTATMDKIRKAQEAADKASGVAYETRVQTSV